MPIAMSKDEWSRIIHWTEQGEDPETVRQREYVRYLDTTSTNMTKHWPNSFENVNKRNEELRRARIEATEQTNNKFYKRYLKLKKEEQVRLMFSARDIVFKNKDAPKQMLSAVIETCVQKERMEQLKFQNELRRQAAEQKKKEDDGIIQRSKEWHQLVATKKKRRFDVNKQHQKEILDQAHEISERNRMDYENELKMQQIDNIKANEQIKALKEFEENFDAAEKARILGDMQKARDEAAARRAEQAARDNMDNRLIDVLLKSRARVERQRKKTEQDVKAAKQSVLDKISAKLQSGSAARDAKELAILNKAIKEKDDIAAAKREALAQHQADLRKQRLDSREKWLRDEKQRLHEFNNNQHWECMNRFKNIEIFEDFKEGLRKEKERKTKEFREDTLRLWKERDEREARERAETRYFYGELAEKKMRDADNRLLTHVADLVREAHDNGRPSYALHGAVDRYCKLNRLYPMPDLPASVAKHFKGYAPRDGSKPDAHYRAPPAPPPDAGPDAPDEEPAASAPSTTRNGLDDPVMPTTSKITSKKEREVPEEEYKRCGRANGLQRRKGQHDLTLPPLAVPCQTPACSCDLKK